MATDQFSRRLDEALAATAGSGVDVPVDNSEDWDGDGDFEPDPRTIRAMYEWVQNAPSSILSPVIGALEEVEPQLYASTVRITDPAGYGYSVFSGRAAATATWKISEGDPGYGAMELGVRMTMMRSDLWKALGVDYNQASKHLDNDEFMTGLLRAMAFKLGDMNHAAYWLHLVKGKAADVVTAQIARYVKGAGDRLLDGASRLAKKGIEVGVEPGSLRVYPSEKAVNVMRGSTPVSKLAPGGGFSHVPEFTMSARLDFNFGGTVDLLRQGEGGFGSLSTGVQGDVVRAMRTALEHAWEELSDDFEVSLNPSGGSKGSYWEPAEGPEFDPEWYPEGFTYTIPNWQELFEDDEPPSPTALAGALSDITPAALHLMRARVDCTRAARDREYGVELQATLALKAAKLDDAGLVISLVVTSVDVT